MRERGIGPAPTKGGGYPIATPTSVEVEDPVENNPPICYVGLDVSGPKAVQTGDYLQRRFDGGTWVTASAAIDTANISAESFTFNQGSSISIGSHTVGFRIRRGSDPYEHSAERTAVFVQPAAAPVISSSVPTDNATDVAIDSTIAITFDKNVLFIVGGGDVVLRDNDGGWADLETFAPSSTTAATGSNGGSISISGAVMTITPGDEFVGSTEHAIRIDSDVIEETVTGTNFAGVADDTSLSFTSVATAFPELTATYVDGAQGTLSTDTLEWPAIPIGDAFASRRVICIFPGTKNNAVSAVDATIGGVTCDTVIVAAQGNNTCIITSAIVPTGTTAVPAIQFSGNPFGNQHLYAFVVDDDAVGSIVSDTDGVTSATSASTATNVSANGSILTGIGFGNGASKAPVSITDDQSDTFTLVANGTGATAKAIAGYANLVNGAAPTNTTIAWTPSLEGAMATIAFNPV